MRLEAFDPELRSAHATYFARYAFEELRPHLRGPSQHQALQETLEVIADLELAQAFWLEKARSGEALALQRLAEISHGYVCFLTLSPNHARQAWNLMQPVLELCEQMPAALAALLLEDAAIQCGRATDFHSAKRYAQRALEYALRAQDDVRIVGAQTILSFMLIEHHEYDQARALIENVQERLSEHDETVMHGWMWDSLARLEVIAGRVQEGIALHRRALEIFRRGSNPWRSSAILRNLAKVHWRQGEITLAVQLLHEGLQIQRETDGPEIAWFLHDLARVELERCDWKTARSHLHEALESFLKSETWEGVTQIVTLQAELLERTQASSDAARILGHIEYLRGRHWPHPTGETEKRYRQLRNKLQTKLEPETLKACLIEGHAWTDSHRALQVELELNLKPNLKPNLEPNLEPKDSLAQNPSQHVRLSKRQLEVMHLIREGHSNKRIAQRLELSESTIKFHITEIFNRLGVRTRVQAIREISNRN